MTLRSSAVDAGADTSNPRARMLTLLALAIIAIAALALRLNNLENQAPWGDEFASIVIDPSTTFTERMALNRFANPDHVPIFYVLVYWWSQLLDGSLPGVRMLSVAFSLLALPGVYLLGRMAGGRRAGLIAAMLYAMSPYYIYQAQGVRPYAMVLCLAAFSLFTLVRAANTDRVGWWAAHVVVTLLLIYVHLAAVFLLPAQGLYLLIYHPHRFRRTALWTAGLIACILPVTWWMLVPPQDPFFETPDLMAFLKMAFAKDSTRFNIEMSVENPVWASPPGAFAQWMRSLRPFTSWTMLSWHLGVCLAAGLWLCRRRRAVGDAARDGVVALMVLSVLVPVLILVVISYVKEPMPMPRYSVYGNIALYALSGWLLTRIPWLLPRRLLVLVLLGMYAYQLAWVTTSPLRTNWFGAIREIRAEAQPGDVIVAGNLGELTIDGDQGVRMMLRYCMGREDVPVYMARTLPQMLRLSACQIQLGNPATGANPRASTVWLLLARMYNMRALPELEAAFTSAGLEWRRSEFPTLEGLTLYRLRAAEPPPPPGWTPASLDALLPVRFDASEVLDSWQLAFEDPADRETATAALYRAFDDTPPLPVDPISHAYMANQLSGLHAGLAIALAEKALALNPESASAHFSLGAGLFAAGRREEARAAFQAFLDAPVDEFSAVGERLARALAAGDRVRANAEAARLLRLGMLLPEGLTRALGVHEQADLCPG